jgi:nitrate reductase gamma subunit
VVFVVAFVVRAVGIARLPVHLRWELAPVPKEKGRGRYGGSYLEEYEWWKKPREESLVSELVYMGKEILLLKALWEHNRALWWFSFPFHWALYLLIGSAGLTVLAGGLGLAGVEGAASGVAAAIPVVAGAAYLLGLVGTVGLLARRVLVRDMRMMTTRVAYFNLILLGAVFGTGLWAALSVPAFAGELVGYAGGLLTADAAALPVALAAHVVATLLFLAYLPFSQMMHFVAKYFTYHEVRWEDEPLVPGGRLEKEVLEQLQQPVSWAGPHVGADGKKNWVDIATQEVGK